VSSYTFTSESVTEGHPDKLADQVSDAVLDAILAADPAGRVACETLATTGLVVVAGEISTREYVEIPNLVRQTICEIGYDREAYGFDGITIDGGDPEEVYRVTARAVEKARSGGGPTLVEAKLRRLRPHSSDDDDRRYLSEEEREALQRHDPMDTFRRALLRRGVLDEAGMAAVNAEVKALADQAADEAEKAPEARAEDILKHVFAEDR